MGPTETETARTREPSALTAPPVLRADDARTAPATLAPSDIRRRGHRPNFRALKRRCTAWLTSPVDIASLAAFRVLFGVMMLAGLCRFMASGWIDILYVQPTFFFKYYGFDWVPVWSPPGLWAHFGLLALLALCVALGLFYRVSIVLFTLGFIWVQLFDVTNYLNHYVLVACLGMVLSVVPAHGAWSLDARRRPDLRLDAIPRWMLALLQVQVAVVYFYAGIAKVGEDWLIHGEPMITWMRARDELPLIGAFVSHPLIAHAMGWAGMLYDCTIVLWLSRRRTRPWAFAAVLVFHACTWALFDIGMFPFIMTVSATLFFSPSWPRRPLGRILAMVTRTPRERSSAPVSPVRLPRAFPPLGQALLMVYVVLQIVVPLRHFAYPGSVLWNEQGMRFSWKVMLREKNGSVTYHVRDPKTDRVWQVSPTDYLTWRQANEMSGQPDLILQLGRYIAGEFARQGYSNVEVRAETWVSLNGRPPAPLIDPTVNLAAIPDGLGVAHWILPEPSTKPRPDPRRRLAVAPESRMKL